MTQLSYDATQLYERARTQGWMDRVWSAVMGRSPYLMALETVEVAGEVRGHHSAGRQAVPVHQIRGSVSQRNDFDADFRPLRDDNKERWLKVATARQRGIRLPPVELIQVEKGYFVWDGHHRVSVARALGQMSIDAVVTVWQALPRT